MAPVTVYTRPYCRYCEAALALLLERGVACVELDVREDPARFGEMLRRSGRSTFPQVFIGDRHVGGCDDLVALDRSGELARLAACVPDRRTV